MRMRNKLTEERRPYLIHAHLVYFRFAYYRMSKKGDFTIVDFTVPTRDTPVVHPCSEAPICSECRSADLTFFDPTCSSCQEVLSNPKTTVSELFAIMRQWIPQTQSHLNLLTREVLRRGAHVNDRDGLSDLCLLHFASKAGAAGMGSSTSAANLVNSLIMKGANTDLKCHWTDMNPLHYAVYFDCPEVVELFCQYNTGLVGSTCKEFDGGNSLHIAAANLSLSSAKILLNHYNAAVAMKNISGLLPHECVPDVQSPLDGPIANELKKILRDAYITCPTPSEPLHHQSDNTTTVTMATSITTTTTTTTTTTPTSTAKTVIHKVDTPLESSGGSQLSSGASVTNSPVVAADSPVNRIIAANSPVSSTITSTVASNSPDELSLASLGIKIGDKVFVDAGTSKTKKGTLRFAGETMFASGQWAGIELDDDSGKNDGSHSGIRYFSCKPKRGLFVSLKRISKYSTQTSSTHETTTTRPKQSSMATPDIASGLHVGDRVLVSGKDRGMLKFTGAVRFAPGFWMGVELDNPRGNCDGTKGGKQYFKCKPNHGIFVLPSKLQKLHGKESSELLSSGESTSSPIPPTTTTTAHPVKKKKQPPNSLAGTKHDVSRPTKSHSSYISPTPTSLSLATAPDITLDKGMSVFVNKEKGIVQYIGHTEFAAGVWLGIELRRPSGKNDGSVNGKRYFSCKPSYGIFVKPEKATHRGINCSKLLKTIK